MMCALHDVAAQDARARALPLRLRRGVRGGGRAARLRLPGRARATAATSRSPASPPTSTSGCRRRACWCCGSRSTGTSAHGSTPWIGDNAVVKAIDVFRQIESLPFARESSDLFDRPSINLGRIAGGDAINRVPDSCVIDVDIRYLPGPGRRGDPRRHQRAGRGHGHEDLPPPSGDGRPREPLRAGARRGHRARGGPAATSRSRSGATAPRTPPRSSTWACPPWSAGPPEPAITAPRNGCRSGRSASIGRRSWSSCSCYRPASTPPATTSVACASPEPCSTRSPAQASGRSC